MSGGIDNLETPLRATVDEMRSSGEVGLQFRLFGDSVERRFRAAVAVFADEPVNLRVLAKLAEPWRNDNQRAVIRHRHPRAVDGFVAKPRAFKLPCV